jgi:hypothetical protein
MSGVFLMLFVFSCSSNNDDMKQESNPLLSKWALSSIKTNTGNRDLNECQLKQTIEFLDNVEVLFIFSENSDVPCGELKSLKTNYTLEDNKLTFIDSNNLVNDEPYTFVHELITLNNEQLIYKQLSDNNTGIYPEDQRLIFTYTKVD